MSPLSSVPWWQGWPPLLVLPAAVLLFFPAAWPRWLLMWALVGSIYLGFKWLTWRRTPVAGVPFWRHAGYLLAWTGLDAVAFLTATAAHRPARSEWSFAVAKILIGLGVIFGAARWVPEGLPYLTGWVGMIGLILVLHFGLFQFLRCAWRAAGVEARPLMRWPLASTSLGELWGRRWNTAFRDLTHRFLFRPLTPRLGPSGALFVVFLVSGLIHDLVVSIPAGGGYGGPTLFFLVQSLGIYAERSRRGRALGLGRGLAGWLFTMLILAVPVWLLFHPPFVLGVIVPFLRDLGAISCATSCPT